MNLPLLQRTANKHLKARNVHRLGDEIIGPPSHCLDRRIHRSVGCHHDADGRILLAEDPFHEFHAVLRAYLQIRDDKIHGIRL